MRRLAVVATVVCLVVLGFAAPATAGPGEVVHAYDTRVTVRSDGTMDVVETIAYDFGPQPRHGIFRKIPERYRYDGRRDRVYPVSGVAVTMDGGAAPVQTSESGGYTVVRIGDPDRTVTGAHTYVIRYTVRGALNHFPDHEELYWNVIGDEWTVPVEAASATVTGPAGATRAQCYAGPAGFPESCSASAVSGGTATFHQSGLSPAAALTVVVAFPSGSVRTGPILQDRHIPFLVTPWTVGGGLGLAVLVFGSALLLAWRAGRDRRYVGTLPGLVPAPGEAAVEERKPLYGGPPVSVEFTPPDNIRPGQVGTLVDERADVLDVTATIVDFAVRKHLRIREIRPEGARKPTDWELIRLTEGDPDFLSYERDLFGALFRPGNPVRLSELRGKIAADVRHVRNKLDADLVTQGWYRRSPYHTRVRVLARVILAILGAVVVTVVLAIASNWALLGVGLLLGTLATIPLIRRFPARTGKGSAMLERVRGLRLYIATAEAEQIRFQERVEIFSRYLPYAIVFGLAERWARVFGGIGAEGFDGGLYWYEGGTLWGGGAGYHFDGMQDFTATVGSVGTATPPSVAGGSGFSGSDSGFSGGGFSGGGFSDGGGGGGGGGSW